jgi:ComF family protein
MQTRSFQHLDAWPARTGWIAPRCVVCALAPGSPLCDGCERDFFAREAVRCDRCAIRLGNAWTDCCGHCLAEPPHFDTTTALADYVAPVSGMIAALKFGARLDLAEAFARLLAAREPRPGADLVVAVPLSFERESERGFNQSLEIARRFARLTGATMAERTLLRVRHTPPQQSLARGARRRNVRGAFGVSGDVRGARLVVVDDVMTTGSTLNEIADTLKRAGAARVVNRVVARTP